MARRSMKFTKGGLERLPVPPKRWSKEKQKEIGQYVLYHDTVVRALCVSVASSGRKSFLFYRRAGGKPVKKTIGTYPEMSIDQARELVSRMNRIKSAGHNPVDPNCEITEFMSLGELFERYLRLHGKPYRRSWQQDVGIFHNHLEPLRDREIGTLTRVELQELHARIGETRGKQVANRVRSILHVLFEKAIEWGYPWPNPVAKIKPYKKPQRERFLQPEELPRFFKTLNKSDRKRKVFDEVFRDWVLLLLLTGARKSNLLSMRWENISLERSEWTIPGEETKSGDTITVPLCSQAAEILKRRQESASGSWVFPNKKGDGPMPEPRRTWWHFRVVAGVPDVTLHDLRRTLGSWMAITGASLPVIARALGHKLERSSVTAVYARLNNQPVREAIERAVDAMQGAGEFSG